MKNFTKFYKEIARDKAVHATTIAQYCIFKALYVAERKGLVAIDLADSFLRRSFTPITRKNKLDNGRFPFDTLRSIILALKYQKWFLLKEEQEIFDTQEEYTLYKQIVDELYKKYTPNAEYISRKYVYIFVRQDISPEYQAVQAAHVAAKMGYEQHKAQMHEDAFAGLYFALIGVPNVAALNVAIEDIRSVGGKPYLFHEPDIGNELTAVASNPIPSMHRKRLLSYKKLTFKK